jgi:hypothetical protein
METVARTEVKVEKLEVRLPSRCLISLAHAAKTGVAVIGRDIADLRVSHVSFLAITILMMCDRSKVNRLANHDTFSG